MPARTTSDRTPVQFPFSREFVVESTGGSVVWVPERDCHITHLAFLSEEPDTMLELVPAYSLVERVFPPRGEPRSGVWIPDYIPTVRTVGRQRIVTRFSSKHLGVLWPHSMKLPAPLVLEAQQEFVVRGPRGIAVVYGIEVPDWNQGREEES